MARHRLRAFAGLCRGAAAGAGRAAPAVLVVGGLAPRAAAATTAAQERGVDGSDDDFAIQAAIEKACNSADPRLHPVITTTVYNGRVLLTGQVRRRMRA